MNALSIHKSVTAQLCPAQRDITLSWLGYQWLPPSLFPFVDILLLNETRSLEFLDIFGGISSARPFGDIQLPDWSEMWTALSSGRTPFDSWALNLTGSGSWLLRGKEWVALWIIIRLWRFRLYKPTIYRNRLILRQRSSFSEKHVENAWKCYLHFRQDRYRQGWWLPYKRHEHDYDNEYTDEEHGEFSIIFDFLQHGTEPHLSLHW